MTELDELGAYKASLEGHAMKVLDPGQRVEVRGMPRGRLSRKVADGSAVERVRAPSILDPVLDSAVRAEREGFDAFVVGSFSEPFLRELRSAIDISVVSVTEATMLVACSIGRLAAPISNDPAIAWLVRQSIETHGLQPRIQPPRFDRAPRSTNASWPTRLPAQLA